MNIENIFLNLLKSDCWFIMKKSILIKEIFIFTTILFIVFFSNNVYAQEIGAENIGAYPTDYFIEDVVSGTNYLYVAQSGTNEALLILSLASPTNPTLIGTGDRVSLDTVHCVDVNDDETIAVVGASSNLYVFNISDKSNPIRTDELNVGSTIYDVEISGNLVYCAAYSAGLPVINITDVNNPSIIYNGHYSGYNDNWLQGIFIDPDRDYLYAAGGSRVLIFHLDSNKLPETPSTLALSYTAWSVEKISASRLAAGDSYGNIYFVDITNMNSPSLLGSIDVGSYIYGLFYSGNTELKLFAADYDDGLNIVDFSTFTEPTHIGVMATSTSGARGYGVDKYGDYILLAAGPFGLLIYGYADCLAVGTANGFSIPGFELLSLIGFIFILSSFVIYYYHRKKDLKFWV